MLLVLLNACFFLVMAIALAVLSSFYLWFVFFPFDDVLNTTSLQNPSLPYTFVQFVQVPFDYKDNSHVVQV